VNDWAKPRDQFRRGRLKASSVGRMRGFAFLDDSIEYKHIRFGPGATPPAG
jgi:betaine-aldehyde dehydrogenase